MQKPQKHNQHLEENPLEICAKYKKKKVGRIKKENEKLSLSGEGKQEGVKETKTVSIMNRELHMKNAIRGSRRKHKVQRQQRK